jgi:GNAT superfamily N-acetyltransferase
VDVSSFKFLRLEYNTPRLSFHCGDDSNAQDLTEFFAVDSIASSKQLFTVTYALVDLSENITVAFYSVMNDRIQKDQCNNGLYNRLSRVIPNKKRWKSYPAVKVARFGVHKDYQRKGIGTMLMDYIKGNFIDNNKTGCRFIVVDAYPDAVGFYEQNGFDFLLTRGEEQGKTRSMYFDLILFTDPLASGDSPSSPSPIPT